MGSTVLIIGNETDTTELHSLCDVPWPGDRASAHPTWGLGLALSSVLPAHLLGAQARCQPLPACHLSAGPPPKPRAPAPPGMLFKEFQPFEGWWELSLPPHKAMWKMNSFWRRGQTTQRGEYHFYAPFFYAALRTPQPWGEATPAVTPLCFLPLQSADGVGVGHRELWLGFPSPA